MIKNRFTATIDFHRYRSKPTETGKIVNRLATNTRFDDQVNLTTSQLHQVCTSGHTVAPAIFEKSPITYLNKNVDTSVKDLSQYDIKSLSNKYWKCQQSFFIDIDKRLPISIAKKKYSKEGLQPNFWYFTSSNKTKKEDRYRLIYVLDKKITDKKHAKQIYEGLLSMYPESDNTPASISNIFYAGYGGQVLKDNYTSVNKLSSFYNTKKITENRNVISSINHSETEKNEYKELNKSLQYGDISKSYEKYLKGLKNHGQDWKPILYKSCKLYKSFVEGEWLYYKELRCLATSLIHLKGGYKFMMDMMEKHHKSNSQTTYTDKHFNLIREVNNRKYKPEKITPENNRFDEDQKRYSILHFYKFHSKSYLKLDQKREYITLDKAQSQTKEAIQKSLNDDGKNINIVKAQTAIGKSSIVVDLAPQKTPIVIGHSTHDLKDATKKKFKKDDYNNLAVTKGQPDFKQKNLNYKINKAYQLGLYGYATKLFHLTKNKVQSLDNDNSIADVDKNNIIKDSKEATSYLNRQKEVKDHKGVTLTTHSKLSHTNFEASNNYIYDEDPLLNEILQIKSIDLNELYDLKKIAGKGNDNLYNYFKNELPEDDIQETPDFKNIEKYSHSRKDIYQRISQIYKRRDKGVAPAIFELLDSDMIYKSEDNVITYYSYTQPAPDKNINILSATAPTKVYKALFPERLNVHDVDEAKRQGTIKQFVDHSYSKSSINNILVKDGEDEFLSKIENPKWDTITFESFKNIFENADEKTNLFNCTGANHLTNKNLNVVGTPHLPEQVYKFIYYIITGKQIDDEIKQREIEFNGYKFKFPTYENKLLRNIQLDLIHSQLLQAIGRARTLRNDCEVHLYSNLITSATDSIERGILPE